ncbi:MAG: phage tail protein, partial [Armatimonadia bacterium]
MGSDQYVRQLFILGYSDIALVSEIRIGDTPLSYYREVQWEFIPQTARDAYPKYYSSDVNEEALSVQLKEPEWWNYRTTAQECDRFSIDLSFPRGLVEFEDDGGKKQRSVTVDALYRKVGDVPWISITGDTPIPAEEFKVSTAFRRTYFDEGDDGGYVETPQNYVLCCSPSGDVEVRQTTVVPAGYYGLYSFQILGKALQNVVSLLPLGATGFGLTKTGDGFSYVKVTLGAGTLPMGDLVTVGKQTTAMRRSFTVTPGARGFYEVAVRRVTADSTKDNIVDEVWWGALRAISFVAPIQFPHPLAALSLRIKATGQLNGVIDELNVDAVTVCKDWDYASGQWVVRPTENPASLFRYVLQHPANSRRVSDAQIDLVRLQAWHNFCRVNGFSYSRYHDFADGVYAVLQDIASAGRAAVARPDGLWGVVIDTERTTIAQHFTPENSSGFGAEKALPKMPHGWRVRFINEQMGYQSDERIVYADGYSAGNATEFEALELPGVTDPSQVWKLARYHYAVAKLRPEEYEFYADMEHIVCTRGDLIRMAHDVPLWGVAQGRVKAVVGQFVTVDNVCTMIAPIRYVARFRLQTGASLLREVVCVDGVNQTIELMGAGAVPAVGDLFMFGELGVESSDLLVKHIEPAANFSARIVAVDYSPAIFTADSGAVPAFQTKITKPYASRLKMPPVPVITLLRSDEAMLIRNADGSLSSRIYIQFKLPSGAEVEDTQIQARYRESGAEAWTSLPPVMASSEFLYAYPVEDGRAYDIELRSVNASGGLASNWTATVSHTAVGKTSKPPTVTGFAATAVDQGI